MEVDEKLLHQVLEELRSFRAEVLSRIGGLETRMDRLEARVSNLEVEVKGIRDEHGLILRGLEERTAILSSTLTRVANDVNDVKGQMINLTERVDDHDIEIEILKKAVGSRREKKLGTP
jgi:archaellum component FlaC